MQRKHLPYFIGALTLLLVLGITCIGVPMIKAKAETRLQTWVKQSGLALHYQKLHLRYNGVRLQHLEVKRGDDALISDVNVVFGLNLKPRRVEFDHATLHIIRRGAVASTSADAPLTAKKAPASLADLLDKYFTSGVSVALRHAKVKVYDSNGDRLLSVPDVTVSLNARERTASVKLKDLKFKDQVLLAELSGQFMLQKQREFYPFLLQAQDPNGEPWQLRGQVSHDFDSITIRHKRRGLPLAWLPGLNVISNPADIRVLVRLKLEGLVSREQIAYDIKVASNNLSLQHPSLGKSPLGPWPFTVHSSGIFVPETASLDVNRGSLSLLSRTSSEPLNVTFAGHKDNLQAPVKDDPLAIAFHVRSGSCQSLLDALPENLLPVLKDLKLDGNFGVDGTMRLVNSDDFIDFTPGLNFNACRIRSVPYYLTAQWLMDPNVEIPEFLQGNPSMRAVKSARKLGRDAIPDDFFKALVAAEDATFWKHDGILISSLLNALQTNLRAGHVVLGGSTITMQLAKNLFLDRERVISRKVQEIMLAWVLEHTLSKSEILELYANAVEFAPDVYGVGSASQLYFDKSPDAMSSAEAMFLASILPSPAKNFAESYCQAHLTRGITQRMQRVAGSMATLSREADFLSVYARDLGQFHFAEVLQGCDRDFTADNKGQKNPAHSKF